MKKSIFLVAAALLMMSTIYNPCKAQEKQDTNSAQFGIKGGVNFSTLYTKDAENNKMLPGFNVGLFSKLPITGYIAFQPEIYFTTKGAEVTYNNTFVDGTATYKFNYVEMPLLLVVGIADNFNISFGPYASYLVSGKVVNDANINLFDFEENINADDYNRIDAGITAGAAFDFGSVSVGARYSYGLTKVGREKTYMGTTYTFPDGNNGVLNFYAAIPLHKN